MDDIRIYTEPSAIPYHSIDELLSSIETINELPTITDLYRELSR